MASTFKTLGPGIIYSAFARYGGVIISLVIGAILARLLSPEEFGIVALISVYLTFFNLLSDFGLGSAVVHNQTLTSEDIRSIFSFSVILALVLAFLFFISAPIISNFYNKDVLLPVMRYLSLSVLFQSLLAVPQALIQKDLRFKQIGIITLSVQLITGVVSIVLAYIGFSFYALVIQSVLASFISFFVFYWLSPISFNICLNWLSIRKVLRFSSFQFLFNFINYFSRNADNILIAKFMGSSALGFYDKSYRLMLMPVQNLTHVVTPVLLPVLSKYQDDKDYIFQSYLKVVRLLAVVGFPLSVLLYFSASEIIHLLFGSQWGQSVPVFKLLSLTVGIQIVLSSTGAIFQAVNRTDLLFISGLLGSVIMISGISYGIFFGKNLEAIGYGLIVAFAFSFFQGFYFLIVVVFKYSYFKFLKIFVFPIFVSLVIFGFLFFVNQLSLINLFYFLLLKTLFSFLLFLIMISFNSYYREKLFQFMSKYNFFLLFINKL